MCSSDLLSCIDDTLKCLLSDVLLKIASYGMHSPHHHGISQDFQCQTNVGLGKQLTQKPSQIQLDGTDFYKLLIGFLQQYFFILLRYLLLSILVLPGIYMC